ncbi:hypothetical protein SAMN02745866_02231 [Alteromonadaceae bacterium Bs31]|nr:hypothetical protein SAMN02745866_02231 [Alteromonadaceae bacterium Bs31]
MTAKECSKLGSGEGVSENAVIKHGVNRGMPVLALGERPTSFFEFWPAWLMYIPVVVYWLLLSIRYRSFGLPMAVNPNIELGGMVGESKHAILGQAGEALAAHILPYIVIKTAAEPRSVARDALARAAAEGLSFPLVIKPDLGCRGRGVALMENEAELVAYLSKQNQGQLFLLQRLAPYQAEAGVFYIKHPGEEKGRLVSLALKYRPTVEGDGSSTLEQLILRHPRAKKLAGIHLAKNREQLARIPIEGEEVPLEFAGSHCRGSIFRNGKEFICPALEQSLDCLLKELPEFNYGRLDIKFKNIDALMAGKDFYIVEINGASSEQAHIWDSRTPFAEAMGVLLKQYGDLFAMGASMREHGHHVPSVGKLVYTWLKELGYFGANRVGK